MKITDLKKQKKSERISVYVDDKFCFGLTQNSLFDHELFIGKELTQKEIDQIKEEDEKNQAFAYIIYQLGFGCRTEKEIIKKMQKKKIPEGAQSFALKKAKRYGYIDDSQYCENFIEQHKHMSGWGEKKILSALLQKGINIKLAKEKLSELYSEEEGFEVAYSCAVKKMEILQKREKDPYKRKQKLYAFLISRGYSYDVIQKVLSKIKGAEE